jgi:hypothetical protein
MGEVKPCQAVGEVKKGVKVEITRKWLKEQRACADGIEWFNAQKETDSLKVLDALIKDKKLDYANWLIVRLMTYRQYVSYAVYAAEQVIDLYEKQCPDDKRPRQAIEAAKKCIDNPSEENKQAADAAARVADAATNAAYAAYAAYAARVADAATNAAYAAYVACATYAARAATYAADAATYAARAAYAAYAVHVAARAADVAAYAATYAAYAAARAAARVACATYAATNAAYAAYAADVAHAAYAVMKKKIMDYGVGLLKAEVKP